MKRFLSALLVIAWFALLSAAPASAQTLVNCAPSTPCVNGTGPYNTNTGDKAADAFGKFNANFTSIPSQLFTGAALPVNKGGTGALTLTGPLKGNGTGAISPALAADIYALWSGTCSASTFLRGDGSCQTPAGGGNVSNVATPTQYQIPAWTSATTIEGIGPGTAGQALISGGAAAYPSYSAALAGVTSVNGSTVPASTTLAGLSIAETWASLQTFTNSDIALLGSSTGATTFTSANASATNYTLTVPAITDTLATLTATQTLTNKSIAGSEINSGTVGIGFGGTGATSLAGANIPVQSGAITSGHCVQWATATSITDSGATCGAAGSSAFSALTSSTNTTAAMLVGTGASLGVTGSGTIQATSLASTLGVAGGGTGAVTLTGPLKGNGTSALSPAVAADIYGLWSGTCSASTFLRGDGSCQTPAGSGTVTTTGTPASGNLAKFSGATSVTNGDLSGDVTTAGTLAATVVKVNGGAIPASAAVTATNSSGQFTALTLGGNLNISSGVLSTSQSINAQTGTTYAMLTTDAGKLVTFSNAASVAVSLSAATTTGFTAGYSFDVENLGAGTVTITPATSTINGASTLTLAQNTGCTVTSDGTNYQVSACTAVAPGGSAAFSALTTGTNSTATMTVGTGGTLTTSGTGIVNANQINGIVLPTNSGMLVTSVNQIAGGALISATLATGPTNDYSPAGYGRTTAVMYLTPAAGGSTLNGISAQNNLQQLYLVNAEAPGGADNIILANQSASDTTAANRFLTPSATSLTIPPGTRTLCLYLPSPVSRWSCSDATGLAVGALGAIGANTIVANATGSSASPTAVSIPSTMMAYLQANTLFTITPTGCTPSAHAGGPFGGTITLAAGPCTSIVVTMNGATGYTAAHGYDCGVDDQTAQNAGTWIPKWGQTASSTTTATIPIPAAAGATDVISFSCMPN